MSVPARPGEEADDILILLHTLMNPFLMDSPGERGYIDMCWDFLEEAIDAVLVEVQSKNGGRYELRRSSHQKKAAR